jgi:anti-anti-sigma factor
MNLSLLTRELQHATVVDLKGRIVFGDEVSLLRDKVKKIVTEQRRPVVLNLRDVTYIDSGGIGCLVGLYTSAHQAGVELRLACANDKVEHVLKITKLLPVLGAFPDESSALCACNPKSSAIA